MSGTMPLMQMLFLRAVVSFHCFFLLLPASAAIDITAPIFDPQPGIFFGEVLVAITSIRESSCVYYTLDNSTPTDNSERLLKGTVLVLNKPRRYVVKAVAYPSLHTGSDLFTSSEVAVAEYIVKPDVLLPPTAVAQTTGKYFRGTLKVTLSHHENTTFLQKYGIAFTVIYIPTLLPVGTRDALPPALSNATWQVYNNSLILLDRAGTHILWARGFEMSLGKRSYGPRAGFLYRLREPLTYDVSTECCDNPYQPVLGHMFTIWISNLWEESSLFLTISAKGCETGRHILDDTDVVRVKLWQVAVSFVTYTEEHSRVFVCVKEGNNSKYVTVPRRLYADWMNKSEDNAFSIVTGPWEVKRRSAPNTTFSPQPQVDEWKNNRNVSGDMVTWMIFLLAVALVLAARIHLGYNSNLTSASATGGRMRMPEALDREERQELREM